MKRFSDSCFVFGISWIVIMTFMMCRDIGTYNPAYTIDWKIPLTGFLSFSGIFAVGYFAGRKKKKNMDFLKQLALTVFFTALVIFIGSQIGNAINHDRKEKKTSDSLEIVKLNLEIELEKMQLNEKK
jgi:membrane-bound acyltransferase YfiQ involved in biofilm formation